MTAESAMHLQRRPFELTVGLRDDDGRVYRHGFLRRARVRDELEALKDFRVYLDEEFVLLALLERVVSIEGLGRVPAAWLETLTVADRDHLERLYRELNGYPSAEGRRRHEV